MGQYKHTNINLTTDMEVTTDMMTLPCFKKAPITKISYNDFNHNGALRCVYKYVYNAVVPGN